MKKEKIITAKTPIDLYYKQERYQKKKKTPIVHKFLWLKLGWMYCFNILN